MSKFNLAEIPIDQLLADEVFPKNWVNPKPKEQYDVVVIGGGPGGMSAALTANAMKLKVAIVEKQHMGGECFNYGCIPSKALLRSARLASQMRKADEFGLQNPSNGNKVDLKAVIERVHKLQKALAPGDAAERFKKLGIDVFLGAGHFTGKNTLEVSKQTIQFKKAIIVTGTAPVLLNMAGIERSDYFTNETIFNLTTLPKRLGVIGGGPIGCELSQAMLHFGSEVTLITLDSHLLPKDDIQASELLQRVFQEEGMKVFTNSTVSKIEKKGQEKILYLTNGNNKVQQIVVDELLVAIGRKPVVDGLNLETAGVKYDVKGIHTNDYLQTSNPNIYAAGDITSKYKFTHISMELCTMAAKNAVEGNKLKQSALHVPWCTFTQPEIAHIGINEADAKAQAIPVETSVVEMNTIARAVVDSEATGFAKLIVKENSDQILGGTIVGYHAGDLLHEFNVAMNSEAGLSALANAIHIFPTQGEIVRTVAQNIVNSRTLKK